MDQQVELKCLKIAVQVFGLIFIFGITAIRRRLLRPLAIHRDWRSRRHGLLPLRILQTLVGWAGLCLHPVKARDDENHQKCGNIGAYNKLLGALPTVTWRCLMEEKR